MDNDLLTQKIIGAAIEVHKTLGPYKDKIIKIGRKKISHRDHREH